MRAITANHDGGFQCFRLAVAVERDIHCFILLICRDEGRFVLDAPAPALQFFR
jgi:hypothetical protein